MVTRFDDLVIYHLRISDTDAPCILTKDTGAITVGIIPGDRAVSQTDIAIDCMDSSTSCRLRRIPRNRARLQYNGTLVFAVDSASAGSLIASHNGIHKCQCIRASKQDTSTTIVNHSTGQGETCNGDIICSSRNFKNAEFIRRSCIGVDRDTGRARPMNTDGRGNRKRTIGNFKIYCSRQRFSEHDRIGNPGRVSRLQRRPERTCTSIG